MKLPKPATALVAMLFFVAFCAMIYQFSVVTSLIFILGDSDALFAIFLALYLLSMVWGTVLSVKRKKEDPEEYISSQYLLTALGIGAVPLLFFVFAIFEWLIRLGLPLGKSGYSVFLWVIGLGIDGLFGYYTGKMLPMLASILKKMKWREKSLPWVLATDYVGSLLGAIFFPLLMFPHLGLFRTMFLAALINLGMAFGSQKILKIKTPSLRYWPATLLVLSAACLLFSPKIEKTIDRLIYNPPTEERSPRKGSSACFSTCFSGTITGCIRGLTIYLLRGERCCPSNMPRGEKSF